MIDTETTVYFRGGQHYKTPRAELPQVEYEVPTDTLDPRYSACTEHRVACDCREAELHEEINELRMEYRAMREALRTILDGHSTHIIGAPNPYTGEVDQPCQCTGCQIARAAGY